jgi:hypothetical protein
LPGVRFIEQRAPFGQPVDVESHPSLIVLAQGEVPVRTSGSSSTSPQGIARMLYHETPRGKAVWLRCEAGQCRSVADGRSMGSGWRDATRVMLGWRSSRGWFESCPLHAASRFAGTGSGRCATRAEGVAWGWGPLDSACGARRSPGWRRGIACWGQPIHGIPATLAPRDVPGTTLRPIGS